MYVFNNNSLNPSNSHSSNKRRKLTANSIQHSLNNCENTPQFTGK